MIKDLTAPQIYVATLPCETFIFKNWAN